MKAIRIHTFGGPEAIVYENVAEPQLKAGEVLVKTAAAGVNPIDWKTCSGGGAAAFIGDLPFTPGWEFSGQVIACGADVSGFESGDRVFGFVRFPEAAGCYAEEIAVPAEQICLLPPSCDAIEAAGLALAGLTAWQALFDKGGLHAKQRVLILAAAGGVGHLAVQLAKWKGATVIGTASAANHDFIKDLGCDQVIDYTSQHVAEMVSDVDVVIDGVGGKTGIDALACLKATGTFVTLPSNTKDEIIAAGEVLGLKVLPLRVEPNAAQLRLLAELNAQQRVRLNIAATYPLEQAADAFRDIASGHTQGKVILTV
ncbi:NADP-dependent oxidoreductase [Neptunomonas antarctica]|uniref:NADPH2:quinone reductase n=1 Tax=Neptunomonas antarctica TaxID=619304 RepID=A0A1N7IRW1_9GAMM|nr:NADP-dependent oxidoreductase [Neptunomonas antarctica]SIS39845.1 NADPH2:quinone reductase [Neptunomonas antarctica]